MRQRFDVTRNLEKLCKILETKQAQSIAHLINEFFNYVSIISSMSPAH
jgi:hypothetical protein